MKYTTRTTLLIFLITIFLFFSKAAFGKEVELRYSQKDIYNYFSGIVSLNQDFTTRGFNHLNKVQYLKDIHSNYNLQFIRTLILLEKFDFLFLTLSLIRFSVIEIENSSCREKSPTSPKLPSG